MIRKKKTDRSVINIGDWVSSFEPIRESRPTQLDLFGSNFSQSIFISYFNVDEVDQESFLNAIAKNGIRLVIDLRSVSVFPKRSYDHKYVTSYLHSHDVHYIETSLYDEDDVKSADQLVGDLKVAFQDALRGRIRYSACVFDANALHEGALGAFRMQVARSGNMIIERPMSFL